MKNFSANVLAIVYSAIIAAIVLITVGVLDVFLGLKINWGLVVVVTLICLVVSFLMLRFLLFSFIYDRIKLIYKTINKRKEVKGVNRKKFSYSIDLIKQVDKDVNNWASEQELQMEEIIEMSNYRKEFVGNVSHELKTPIFNIQGYTLTLLEGGLQDETINERYLKKIEKNINRMINIVNDLDEITRLEAGQLKLRLKSFDPVELCRETIESIEKMAKEKKIKVNIINNLEKQFNVNADKEFIRQVFSNLLINAIHYNNVGGTVKAEFFEMGKNILIEITDNGVGISEEDLPRVFERFFRVDKSRSLNSGGSGLGLAIVKHIIEAHGQKLNVRSTIGVGTTIAFTLKKE